MKLKNEDKRLGDIFARRNGFMGGGGGRGLLMIVAPKNELPQSRLRKDADYEAEVT